ncbi:MAG: hypothetical protein Q9226_005092 [Calogaya cf. arnoldii]
MSCPSLPKVYCYVRMMEEGHLAIFDLGIITGLMVLADSPAKVSKLIASGKLTSFPIDFSSYKHCLEDDETASDSDDLDHTSHSRRLYLQWRGYDTRTGEIQQDPHNHNTGYIDFEDTAAMTFSGMLYLHHDLGSEVHIKGYRIPGMAGPVTMNWDALSHLPSDRAKVPKHIW